jgi:hypothetical protein
MEKLIAELKKYKKICFYPSSGPDLSDLDYLCSGRLPYGERVEKGPIVGLEDDAELPDLFLHTDINFYMEFEEGHDLEVDVLGFNGDFEVLSFEELDKIFEPNLINDNYDFSGRVFKYQFKAWGQSRVFTLIYILCENEFFISKIALDHNLPIDTIWSKNWAGGRTYGTWMANVMDRLNTKTLYSDWLCIPGRRGEPSNALVQETYPELMGPKPVKLLRSAEDKWIDEGANGWVERFDIA